MVGDVMGRNCEVTSFFSKYLYFKLTYSRQLFLSKLQPFLSKKSLKTQKKLKELEILYQHAFVCWYSNICWFPMKKRWCQKNAWVVSRGSFIFGSSLGKAFCPCLPHPWASPKRPILNRINIYITLLTNNM